MRYCRTVNSYKQINENWQKFLNEDDAQKVAGIDSRAYPDSLINILKPDPNKPGLIPDQQLNQLLQFFLNATKDDNIVLEAIGDPTRDSRTYSGNTTKALNDLISSFELDQAAVSNLEKALNQWAKLNTVKFSPSSAATSAPPPTASSDPTDAPDPRLAGAGEPTVAEPEPEARAEPEPEAPAEPEEPVSSDDSEPVYFRDIHGFNGGEPFVASPETALKSMLYGYVPLPEEGPDALQKDLKYAKFVNEKGGGLVFKDRRTNKYTNAPKWVIGPDRSGRLPYDVRFAVPAGLANRLTAAARELFNSDTSAVVFTDPKKINNQSKINLRNYIDVLEKAEAERKDIPPDPDDIELQESFNHLQVLAGIKRGNYEKS